MLQNLGFSDTFLSLITAVLLYSSRLSILINDSPMGYFACSRGVRQGDPLSLPPPPPLFLLC
ncbi:hypothetical protein ACS0TY_034255 [Phlomoides rotata]